MHEQPISIFDNVRIRATPLTDQMGLSGAVGQVYGQSVPSITGVEVVGYSADDLAYNVAFTGRGDYWFAAELLELVDHGPGTEIGIGNKKWIISASGEMIEQPTAASSGKKSWWKFW